MMGFPFYEVDFRSYLNLLIDNVLVNGASTD